MSKNLKTLILDNLTWWLNYKNFETEIWNKQCLKSENWNFEWNKLVSGKWYKQYDTGQNAKLSNWEIKSIDVIDWKLYISYRNPSNSNKIDIMQWYEWSFISGTNNINTHFFYIDSSVSIVAWQVYSITLTWVSFTYWPTTFTYTTISWDTADNVYLNLASQIDAEAYFIAEVGITTLYASSVYYTQKWIFFGPFGKNTSTATESWLWYISNSFIINNWYYIWIFKSWNDFILINNSYSPIYYKKFTNSDMYFWQEISWFSNFYIWLYYSWKILLANWQNNLLYSSKTSTATEPYLVKDFSWYNSSTQRIWWDWKITWLISWENWIYVFKEDEIYYSNTEDDNWTSFNFIFNRITNNWAKDKYCITRANQDIFYYDWINKKIRRLSYEQNLTTLRDTSISDEIDELLQNQPNEYWIQQKLYYSYPNLYFACRESTNVSWYNDALYIYNVENEAWTIETNKPIKFWYWKYFSKENTTWEIYEDLVWNTTSTWIFESKVYSIIDDDNFKRFWWFFINWIITPESLNTKTLVVDIYIDWILKETRTISSLTSVLKFNEKIDMFNDWRTIQFKITHSWLWAVEINNVNIYYKPIKTYNSNYF